MDLYTIVVLNMLDAFGKTVLDIIFFPLRIFYFNGPSMLGLYEGSEKETICASITKVRSEFWARSEDTMDECDILLQRKFNAFVIGSIALVSLTTLVCNLYMISLKHYLLQPLAAELKNEINTLNNSKETSHQRS